MSSDPVVAITQQSPVAAWGDAAQPPAGGDLQQGARRRCGDAARVVLRRSDGARRRSAGQGRTGDRLHVLLLEEPPDRRGLPEPDPQVPYFTDVNHSRVERVEKTLRSMALTVADEPEVAAACTTALLSGNDDAVRSVRDRIGARDPPPHPLGRRPGCRPAHARRVGDDVLRRVGQRRQRCLHLSPDRRPPQLCGRPHLGRRQMTLDALRHRPRPVRLRLPRGSVSVLQAAARRGSALSQRETRLLGVVAAPGRAAGFPQQHDVVQQVRGVARSGLARSARVQDHVVPGDG